MSPQDQHHEQTPLVFAVCRFSLPELLPFGSIHMCSSRSPLKKPVPGHPEIVW